jgi:hypothetical protein
MAFTFHGLILLFPSDRTKALLRENDFAVREFDLPIPCVLVPCAEARLDDYRRLSLNELALFLDYVMWAGLLEDCRGFFIEHGLIIVGSEKSAEAPGAESIFRELLADLGVTLDSGGYFAPFDRRAGR